MYAEAAGWLCGIYQCVTCYALKGTLSESASRMHLCVYYYSTAVLLKDDVPGSVVRGVLDWTALCCQCESHAFLRSVAWVWLLVSIPS